MRHTPREPSLAAALLDLAAAPAPGSNPAQIMGRLTEHSLQLPGIQAGGVLLADTQGRFHDLVASDEAADRLEHLQIHYEEGPCRDTVRTGQPLTDLPLPHPNCRYRWPHFTPHALAAGFTAVTALPVRRNEHIFGALNLFHRYHSIGQDGLWACQMLAEAAALGLAHQRDLTQLHEHNTHLETALTSRIVIEQAKGILAERLRLDPDAAFDRMRRHARAHQQKLNALAAQIIYQPAKDSPFPRPHHG
ncbi:ANTAR domain-containing protein [Streptomyces sp. NPDC059003]|uniref:ANTAR domain-containing protein n=1 Tax=Streptomyces sp. NPDC059003 TaxID=3346691 RepID=UPI0036902406